MLRDRFKSFLSYKKQTKLISCTESTSKLTFPTSSYFNDIIFTEEQLCNRPKQIFDALNINPELLKLISVNE